MIFYYLLFFFFNDTATTEIYTLSLHDALPISLGPDDVARELVAQAQHARRSLLAVEPAAEVREYFLGREQGAPSVLRSEEHTSELQSLAYLVCRLLLEKKKKR